MNEDLNALGHPRPLVLVLTDMPDRSMGETGCGIDIARPASGIHVMFPSNYDEIEQLAKEDAA